MACPVFHTVTHTHGHVGWVSRLVLVWASLEIQLQTNRKLAIASAHGTILLYHDHSTKVVTLATLVVVLVMRRGDLNGTSAKVHVHQFRIFNKDQFSAAQRKKR